MPRLDLNEFNNEELLKLVNVTPAQFVSAFLKKNPKFLAKIRPGFRPDHVSAAQLTNGVKEFDLRVWHEFLLSILSFHSDNLKKEINEKRRSGAENPEVEVFLESVFLESPSLFSKLISKESFDLSSLIRGLIGDRNDLINKIQEIENKSCEVEGKIGNSNKQAEFLQQQIEEKVNSINDLNKEKQDLLKDLSDKKADILSLKNKLNHLDEKYEEDLRKECFSNIAKRIEGRFKNIKPIEEFQHCSLCVCKENSQGKIYYLRLADVEEDTLVPFTSGKSEDNQYDNRSVFFFKDGPKTPGSCGVWCWSAETHYKDPTKDYITSIFIKLPLVEVFFPIKVTNLESLISYVKQELSFKYPTWNKIFLFKNNIGSYDGVFITSDQFERNGLNYKIKGDILKLPLFRFVRSDFFWINGSYIYKDLCPNNFIKEISLLSAEEALKDYFLSVLSDPSFISDRNTLDSIDPQTLSSFIKALNNSSYVKIFSSKYGYSERDSRILFNLYSDTKIKELAASSNDEKIIIFCLSKNPSLEQDLIKIVKNKWDKDNEETIKNIKDKISNLEKSKLKLEADFAKKNSDFEDLQKLIKISEAELDQLEQQRDDLKTKFNENILQIKKDASEFISELALLKPFFNETVERVGSSFFQSNFEISKDEEISDELAFEDAVQSISENLENVGFTNCAECKKVAGAILFCIAKKVPLVCKGNAELIAKVMASALGKSYFYILPSQNEVESLHALKHNSGDVLFFPNAFERFTSSSFNLINSAFHCASWGGVVLSVEGLELEDLPPLVLDNAVILHTDSLFERTVQKALLRLHIENIQVLSHADSDTSWREARRSLRVFSPLLSNKAVALYAELKGFMDIDSFDQLILFQIFAQSKVKNLEEKFDEILGENNITTFVKPIN